MTNFSSCYFCGAAASASLAEYPVVPREIDPDPSDGETITLCPTCRQKVAMVVDRILAATDHEDVPDSTADGPSIPEAEDTTAHPRDDSGDSPSSPKDQDAPADPAEDRALDAESDNGTTENDIGPVTPAESDQSGNRDGDTAAGADDDEVEAGETDDDLPGAAPPDVSVQAYNRVARLLQNREFPVPRSEIEGVAKNAYGINPDEFQAILEFAERRGGIELAGDRIRRPDE